MLGCDIPMHASLVRICIASTAMSPTGRRANNREPALTNSQPDVEPTPDQQCRDQGSTDHAVLPPGGSLGLQSGPPSPPEAAPCTSRGCPCHQLRMQSWPMKALARLHPGVRVQGQRSLNWAAPLELSWVPHPPILMPPPRQTVRHLHRQQ